MITDFNGALYYPLWPVRRAVMGMRDVVSCGGY